MSVVRCGCSLFPSGQEGAMSRDREIGLERKGKNVTIKVKRVRERQNRSESSEEGMRREAGREGGKDRER